MCMFMCVCIALYGSDHIYSADTYNELVPPTSDPAYLKVRTVCVCMCMYICKCVCMYVCMYVCICMCMCVSILKSSSQAIYSSMTEFDPDAVWLMQVCMYMCVYVHVCVYVYVYVYIYVCEYLCVCVCVCICKGWLFFAAPYFWHKAQIV